ncbi:helix-turn-helix transcriptional regulator [Fructilactobacillus fructivorans]|uniref:HTH cro/C1-type domain-containing protein n=1 Tax=Fructilactobacillus fructivorans TaxID=1614 RepID=A0A0C1PRI4_9LACO|nr:helix-turn-helix transcriptional regulator [Fructilactobacillus fructivorans]KID42491.1 hypothetical protein LfDm3_0420 [Fructilactobacillus fructivorans]MCT0151591.1 XRE family transcriptional regulator [Fructilactobacillus fructivorans]MCT2868099.1 XRE family transcriptional regulator [Fructilactobacillus fructivorans]MCT2868596.1 XRE family transcriptional regulator [Fructilactobacillus fructivorans]MCT2873778.1 XRE family transcriptional regulator [Fructilactobacillus fructivorans]
MNVVFPERLKSYMQANHLSEMEVANKLSVSKPEVDNWEAGISTPDLTNLINLTKIFNCTIDDLIFGSSDVVVKHTQYEFLVFYFSLLVAAVCFWRFSGMVCS